MIKSWNRLLVEYCLLYYNKIIQKRVILFSQELLQYAHVRLQANAFGNNFSYYATQFSLFAQLSSREKLEDIQRRLLETEYNAF